VDNQYVARTQGFDALEMAIIDFVRRAPNGAVSLYTSPQSPLWAAQRCRLAPVLLPAPGSSLEALVGSASHRVAPFDDLLYLMAVASLLNLVLYPVENFYVPTLLSLQCALLQYQLGLDLALPVDAASLLASYDKHCSLSSPNLAGAIPASGQNNTDKSHGLPQVTSGDSGAPAGLGNGGHSLPNILYAADGLLEGSTSPKAASDAFSVAFTKNDEGSLDGRGSPSSTRAPSPTENMDFQSLIDLLKNEDILKMVLEGGHHHNDDGH
jgi:hypothetical protein